MEPGAFQVGLLELSFLMKSLISLKKWSSLVRRGIGFDGDILWRNYSKSNGRTSGRRRFQWQQSTAALEGDAPAAAAGRGRRKRRRRGRRKRRRLASELLLRVVAGAQLGAEFQNVLRVRRHDKRPPAWNHHRRRRRLHRRQGIDLAPMKRFELGFVFRFVATCRSANQTTSLPSKISIFEIKFGLTISIWFPLFFFKDTI